MVKITPEYLARSGTEDGEQSALFCFAMSPEYAASDPVYGKLWKLLYAIPNGGKREAVTAARMKATGTRKGFPDVGLPVARRGCNALFIELKRKGDAEKAKGRVDEKQKDWHVALIEQGNGVAVCYGWEQAREVIEWYLWEGQQ